ncbi:hypothetical protein [Clostridium estertheticum]|nr:hypothetical protein [Clostridium estertheticum]MBX4265003.1 hypothetical protein [Clostridium estertheticum]WLC81332.1 hypothetical protein KTC98_09020 [Clostridium estertheticum]WLC88470.1 hypothetical protein KTC95_21125 [Clostridium estertheticum]
MKHNILVENIKNKNNINEQCINKDKIIVEEVQKAWLAFFLFIAMTPFMV